MSGWVELLVWMNGKRILQQARSQQLAQGGQKQVQSRNIQRPGREEARKSHDIKVYEGEATSSNLQRSYLSFSLLKTILCMGVAERFANAKTRAWHRLTDKRNSRKERNAEQRKREQTSTVCRYNLHRQLSHISDSVLAASRVFCPFKQFQSLRRLQDFLTNDLYRIEPQTCIGPLCIFWI